MANEDHGPSSWSMTDAMNERRRGFRAAVRRRENGVTVADEPVIHRPPAGRVSERAVNETLSDWA
jgi:hypothetical protein